MGRWPTHEPAHPPNPLRAPWRQGQRVAVEVGWVSTPHRTAAVLLAHFDGDVDVLNIDTDVSATTNRTPE
jgi:hypothetical protein